MNIKKILQKIKSLDEITQFRLFNAFIFAIGINLLIPVLIDLKGEYLAAWAISLFLIGEQLIVKTNRWLTDNYNTGDIFHMGIFIHVLIILTAGLYFINPLWMILAEASLSVIIIAVFGAYTIKLNNHLADNHPKSMNEFQILRNSTWADGLLIGLLAATLITYFSTNGVAIACFVVWNSMYTLWMIRNWNFYKPFIQSGLIK